MFISENGRPEALPKGLPAYIIKTCFSEKWPAGGPAEGTPYLYYKKLCFLLMAGRRPCRRDSLLIFKNMLF